VPVVQSLWGTEPKQMDQEDARMTETTKKTQEGPDGSMKVTVTRNGPYIITGGVPLIVAEICNDNDGTAGPGRSSTGIP